MDEATGLWATEGTEGEREPSTEGAGDELAEGTLTSSPIGGGGAGDGILATGEAFGEATSL